METPFSPFEPDGAGDPRGPRLREVPIRLIIPNVVTLLAICAGLTGVRLAFELRFETAVTMVLIAAFLDGIDGRLARMMKATSRFGAQMDSLADIVNFGVAPGMVLYAYLLDNAGAFGWIAVLIYVIACGLRLARFNVMSEAPDQAKWRTGYFTGVPAPAGAALVMLPIYLGFVGMPHNPPYVVGTAIYTLAIAFLLVSRIPVFSGKGIGSAIRRDLVMAVFLAAVLYVLLLASFPWQTLTLTALGFLLSLPFSTARYFQQEHTEKRLAREEKATPADQP
jgi:CDP-diacylglycerol--serine O-phosphatidyltransferase